MRRDVHVHGFGSSVGATPNVAGTENPNPAAGPRAEFVDVPAAPVFGWNIGPDGSDLTRAKLLDELLKIHEYERQRLGQELHDSAGQLVVALQLSIAHLRSLEEDSGHEDLIEEIQDAVRRIDQEIRSLAFLHYPAELGDRGLCAAVRALAAGFGRRTGIDTSFNAVGDLEELDQSATMALLRVAQEALVNVHRHAHASTATIILRRRDNSIELTVADDGVGIPATLAGTQGIGMQGMRHRVEMLGGRFQVRNLKRGTKISATVPVKKQAARTTKPETGVASCDPVWLTMLG
jgi:signal transduction histidine kinase